MYVRANDPSAPYDTLRHHAQGGDWAYWAVKILSHELSWPVGDYEAQTPTNGSPRQFLWYGPNPPGGC